MSMPRPVVFYFGNLVSSVLSSRPVQYFTAESPSQVMEAGANAQRALMGNIEPSEGMAMRSQLNEFSLEIERLKFEGQVAQQKAREGAERLEELKSHMRENAHTAEILIQDLEKVRDENRLLKESLEDAQSHIFSLQPYRKDLNSNDVSQQYCDLVERIQDWVQKFMEPWLDDSEAGAAALQEIARQHPAWVHRFRSAMKQSPDLLHGSMFPETDEDIIAAMILRFLNKTIFQRVLYGSIKQRIEVVGFIENAMQASVEPKRDLFAVRTWTTEAYNALLSAPQFRGTRNRCMKEMTVELAGDLQIFCPKSQFPQFCQEMEEQCVRPAMELHEKLLVSTHHFYLNINTFIEWSTNGRRFALSPGFYDNVGDFDCKNILQNRRAFVAAKLDPQTSWKQLRDELINVCTVAPALCVRRIGQQDNIKAPIIVSKQRVLVAWGSKEKQEKFHGENSRTLVSRLCLGHD